MSETMTEPKAGWYPDPGSQAPYRWWDGRRWSMRTCVELPAADAPLTVTPPTATPSTVTPPTAGRLADVHAVEAQRVESPSELPCRRSLRQAEPGARLISAPAVPVAASADTPPASPVDLQPAYVPLNPLGGRQPVASPSTPDWRTPDTWIANAPSGHRFDHAVYATGAPFVSPVAAAPAPAGTNALANLGAGFALIGLLYQGVIAVWGPGSADSWTGLAVAGALVVGAILGVAGLILARRFPTATGRPRRAGAVLVLLVSLAALGAQASVAVGPGSSPLTDPFGLVPAASPAAHAVPGATPATPPR